MRTTHAYMEAHLLDNLLGGPQGNRGSPGLPVDAQAQLHLASAQPGNPTTLTISAGSRAVALLMF